MKFIPIKGFDNYAISKEGKIKNVKSDNILKPQYIGSSKQLNLILVNNDNKTSTQNVAKLMIKTFGLVDINIPNSRIRISYKDGNSKNLKLSNIEFTILDESKITGRIPKKECYLHDYKNNTITKYESVYKMADFFNISHIGLYSVISNRLEKIIDNQYRISFSSEYKDMSLFNNDCVTVIDIQDKKEIYQCDLNGNIIQLFPNISTIKRLLNISDPSHIYKSLNDVREIGYGYKWIYKSEYYHKNLNKQNRYDNLLTGESMFYLFDVDLNLVEEFDGKLIDIANRFGVNINNVKTSVYSRCRFVCSEPNVSYISKFKNIKSYKGLYLYDKFGRYVKFCKNKRSLFESDESFYKTGSSYIANYKTSILPIKKVGRFDDDNGKLLEILDVDSIDCNVKSHKSILDFKNLKNYKLIKMSDYKEFLKEI